MPAALASNNTSIPRIRDCRCTRRFGCPAESRNWCRHVRCYWMRCDHANINLDIFPAHGTAGLCRVWHRRRIPVIVDLANVRTILCPVHCYMLLDLRESIGYTIPFIVLGISWAHAPTYQILKQLWLESLLAIFPICSAAVSVFSAFQFFVLNVLCLVDYWLSGRRHFNMSSASGMIKSNLKWR